MKELEAFSATYAASVETATEQGKAAQRSSTALEKCEANCNAMKAGSNQILKSPSRPSDLWIMTAHESMSP